MMKLTMRREKSAAKAIECRFQNSVCTFSRFSQIMFVGSFVFLKRIGEPRTVVSRVLLFFRAI